MSLSQTLREMIFSPVNFYVLSCGTVVLKLAHVERCVSSTLSVRTFANIVNVNGGIWVQQMQSEWRIDEGFCRDIYFELRTENQCAFSCVQPPPSPLIPCNAKSKHWSTRAPFTGLLTSLLLFQAICLSLAQRMMMIHLFLWVSHVKLSWPAEFHRFRQIFSVLSLEQLTLVSETPQISLCCRGNSWGTLGTPWVLCVSWEEVPLLFLSSIPFAKGNALSTVIDSRGS